MNKANEQVNYVLGIPYENTCIIDCCTCWVVGEWFVCIVVLQVCGGFSEVVSSVHYGNGLMTMNWLFLRLFNAAFSCNVRLL